MAKHSLIYCILAFLGLSVYHDSSYNSTRSLLCIPSIKSNSYGGRAFSAAAPELWNSIPEYIKRAETVETFKTRLKTFLFQKHYC